MPGPSTFRIVDLTSMISGPQATMILADQGADLINVMTRGRQSHPGREPTPQLVSPLVPDNYPDSAPSLRPERGAPRALLRLIATADVFVQNFRPGVVERMGLGQASVRSVSPDLSMSRSAALARPGLTPRSRFMIP